MMILLDDPKNCLYLLWPHAAVAPALFAFQFFPCLLSVGVQPVVDFNGTVALSLMTLAS